jgi:predicted enzyme related to lactoylglutathione lyase
MHLVLPGAEDGPTLEIFQYDENLPRPVKRIHEEGFGHIAFLVDDVEECLAQVKAHGGGTVGQFVTSEVPGVGRLQVVYATDPEGNILELQNWS